MPEFVKENTRGKTLYLLKMDKPLGQSTVYVDATDKFKEAEKTDIENGNGTGGPMLGYEIQRATEYAEYVMKHATAETLHRFNNNGYNFFTDGEMPAPRKGRRDVRTNVSV